MRPEEIVRLGDELAGFVRTPADSCVAHDTGKPLTKVLATINATTGDLLLARDLGCDGVLLHHPLAGSARRSFAGVLDRMVELMEMHGVAREAATEATGELRARCRFNDHASDWDHLVSAAKLIGVSLFNVHLAADELGRRVMEAATTGLGDKATVGDVASALRSVPELAHEANEVLLVPEDAGRLAGRVAVMHAGGTNGGASVAEALFDASSGDEPVRTVVYIHLSGADARRLEARAAGGEPGSVVVTGHLASDAIGMNVLMEAIGERGGPEVVRHGGLGVFA